MIQEVFILYGCVLAAITTLFHLKGVPFVRESLSALVAVLLVYPAFWHTQKRRLPIVFFERDAAHALRSVRLFTVTAAVIFPLFFLAAHFYQTLIFGLEFSTRGLNWSWSEAAIQVLLVALPEEFFFRGYLQSALATRFPKRFRPLGLKVLEVSWAVPLTCLIFAASHSIITFRWWHFAIFFPSLVFGWLRDRTGGLIAPVLFHTASNLAMRHIGQLYR
ncbi:MAG TPA: CPBP family intramembrane glutamic endopeptidase [bacterium]|nr:CPBP family intramembrane glutamic endopeptidase [bacterium]